jgi:hypothetical protein
MTLSRAALTIALLSSVACSKTPARESAAPVAHAAPPAPAPLPAAAPADTATAAPAAAGEGLKFTSFELALLRPLLDDVRQGVRPRDGQAFGVCSTTGKDCADFLGSSPGELAPGKYLVKAELAVPRVGERGTWTVAFEVKCTTTATRGSSTTTSTSTYSHSYEVGYSAQDHGYRLMPLYSIESPAKGGARTCSYTLTAPHPDGAKTYAGAWSVPQAQ